MIKTKKLLAISTLMVLSGCTSEATFAAPSCKFEYNSKIEDIVVHALKERFGSTYEFFNYEKPTITRTDNKVELALLPLKEINGHTIMYEAVFVVAVDACSSKLIESYEAKY